MNIIITAYGEQLWSSG